MVCVTVAERDPAQCREVLRGLTFAEVRLDLMDVRVDDIPSLFAGRTGLVATCRPGRQMRDERGDLLMEAIDHGASYVDIEMDSDGDYRDRIIERARIRGCRVIVSYHNYEETPGTDELQRIVSRCFGLGGDLAKIACTAQSARDNARLLGLLDSERPIVVIGIGPLGSITRIMAPLLGSPFTYGAYGKGREVVEGQLDYRTITDHCDALRKVEAGAPAGIIGRERHG